MMYKKENPEIQNFSLIISWSKKKNESEENKNQLSNKKNKSEENKNQQSKKKTNLMRLKINFRNFRIF